MDRRKVVGREVGSEVGRRRGGGRIGLTVRHILLPSRSLATICCSRAPLPYPQARQGPFEDACCNVIRSIFLIQWQLTPSPLLSCLLPFLFPCPQARQGPCEDEKGWPSTWRKLPPGLPLCGRHGDTHDGGSTGGGRVSAVQRGTGEGEGEGCEEMTGGQTDVHRDGVREECMEGRMDGRAYTGTD